jgi:hypothetical protein
MAKKLRKRIWYLHLYDKEYNQALRTGMLEGTEQHPILLFDTKEMAYAYAHAGRFEVKRENGEVLLNEEGYAQLENKGRIRLIGLKPEYLSWKEMKQIPHQPGLKGTAMAVFYSLQLNRQTIREVVQETEEMYHQAINNPLAWAGGVKDDSSLANETVSHENESAHDSKYAGRVEPVTSGN